MENTKDKIYIDNIEIFAHHGVFEQEREEGQTFFVSLELDIDLKRAGNSDELWDTENYSDIIDMTISIFSENNYKLIEAAATRVAEGILNNFKKIIGVKIRVDKPEAPVDKRVSNVAVSMTIKRHRVFLSLGSNLGDRKENLDKAVDYLKNLSGSELKKVSTYINTKAWGMEEQPDFLNAAVEIETILNPVELLEGINWIEKELGRERHEHWGPRTIDIDILLFDDEIINNDILVIPHPYMCEREFVIQPMLEIAPFAIHPLERKYIKDIKVK